MVRKMLPLLCRTSLVVALVAAFTVSQALAQDSGMIRPATTGVRAMTTTLSGAAEVPGPGESDATGRAFVILHPNRSRVCFALRMADMAPPTAAHIHEGAADASGGPVVNFDLATNGLSGCVEADQEVLNRIVAAPEGFYVNVHNGEFPAGAIRGQLAN